MADPSLLRFRAVAAAALAHLEAYRQEVNDLNVFPVADGDTGDNMALTLRAVVDELDRLASKGELDEIGRDEIVDSVARSALLGARGNSGVILSQLIRGAAEELISRPGELVDPVLVGAAMARAADRAYASVRDPAEGTILTVVREMAHRIASELAHMEESRLTPGTIDRQDEVLALLLEKAVEAGEGSVKKGPDLLPALREAGVVDAGGYGLTLLFAGIVAALRNEEPPKHDAPAPMRITRPHHESSTFRFCTNFAVTGQKLKPNAWTKPLEQHGDSVLVVGDHTTLRVHVHTDEPEAVTALFADAGTVSRLDVADMHQQIARRTERLRITPSKCGVLAVVNGDGLADLYRGVGAIPLHAGPTLNPSTYELLAGIHGVAAEEVVVLPNSPNVFMAAERAAELSEKVVHVVASRCQQAGLAAVLAHNPDVRARENVAEMAAVLEDVRCGGVTEAARDDGEDRFKVGATIGFVDEELVSWGEPKATLREVLERLSAGVELITLIAGENAPLDEREALALVPAGVESEWSYGGQPNYWWLIAAE